MVKLYINKYWSLYYDYVGIMKTLRLQVVRSSASNNSMSGAKELHYLLRLLAPAACRNPQLFTEITQQCLRIDLNMTLKRNLMSANSEF